MGDTLFQVIINTKDTLHFFLDLKKAFILLKVRKDIFRKLWTDIKHGDPTKSCTLVKKPLNFFNVFGPNVDRSYLDLSITPMIEKDEEGVNKIEIGKQFLVNAKE